MVQSYILKQPEDLNDIQENGDDFYIIITTHDVGWIRYYIRPSKVFKQTYNVFDNFNNFIDKYSSIVEAVKKCLNQINYEIYG